MKYLTNTKNSYGLIAILLHWIIAILMIGLIILGLYMTRIPISLNKLKYFGWHKEFGMLVLMLVIIRVAWRIINTTPGLNELPRWEITAARTVHILFYLLMFALPMSGWLITSAAGLPVSFFGWFTFPNLITANETQRIVYTEIHEWLSYALIGIVCLHVAAASKHLIINRDEIMQRMLWPHSKN